MLNEVLIEQADTSGDNSRSPKILILRFPLESTKQKQMIYFYFFIKVFKICLVWKLRRHILLLNSYPRQIKNLHVTACIAMKIKSKYIFISYRSPKGNTNRVYLYIHLYV